MELETRIHDLLKGLGIPKHIKGYVYLHDVLLHCLQDGAPVDRNLYTYVARKQLAALDAVKTAISHAAEVAFERYDMPLHGKIFRSHVAPKNDDFIKLLLRELNEA